MSGFINSVSIQDVPINQVNFSNGVIPVTVENLYNIGAGLNDTDNTLSTVGNSAIQLVSNSLFANDNLVSIQSQIDLASVGDVVYCSSGSYGERMVINNKSNIGIIAPNVGNTICELLNGLEITGTSETIRLSSIQFEGTGNLINGRGRHYLQKCAFQGTSISINTLNISGFDAGKFMTLENCEFDNYCDITVANTFAGVLFFINCNFGGATLNFNQFSNQQVIINNSAGLISFPTNATLIGMNVLTTGESRLSTTTLDAPYLLIGGSSTSGSVNEVLTTDGVSGLKLTPMGGQASFFNVFFETKNYTTPLSATTITLFEVANQAGIIPNLRTVINFNANFSFTLSPQVALFKLINTDTSTEIQSFRQTITGTTHQHIPLQFNFTMPDVYTLSYKIEVTTVAGLSAISVDTDDFYSIMVNEIQAPP